MEQRFRVKSEIRTDHLGEVDRFLSGLILNHPYMIFVKEAKDLTFVLVNPAGEKMLGLSSGEMLGKTDYDFFSKAQADQFVAADREVLSSGYLEKIFEEPISTKTGLRYLRTTKFPVNDSKGEPKYLVGISEDITAEIQFSEVEQVSLRLKHLAQTSETLNESLNLSSMLKAFVKSCTSELFKICIVDLYDERRKGVERYASDTLHSFPLHTHLEGGGRDVAFERDCSEFYESKSVEQVLEILGIKEKPFCLERLNSASLLVVPLRCHGQLLGHLCLVASESSQEMTSLNLSFGEELGRRLSLAIQNARLYSKTIEASRAKSSFLANVSHEVRTPLGAVLGFAELLLDSKELPDHLRHHVSTIAKNGQLLLSIVDEVLDLSKVESDKIKIELVRFKVEDFVEDIRSLFKMQAMDKGLDFVFNLSTRVPSELITDPLRLRQILVNLIGNAIKFTDRGAVKVEMDYFLLNGAPGKGRLKVTVEDSGMGITEKQAKKLFQPFSQAEESTSRVFGGTGLGLYLSKKLADLLGGDVFLEKSQLKEGSRFQVVVSAETVEADLPSPSGLSTDVELELTQPELEGRHILVVDDSEDNLALIKGFLENKVLDIDLAGNGVQGVERASCKEYDMVLMDIQMPEMDGFEAVKVLRSRGFKGKVVALTAHAMKGDREKCLESGFDDYLCKPISRSSLTQCISRNFHH